MLTNTPIFVGGRPRRMSCSRLRDVLWLAIGLLHLATIASGGEALVYLNDFDAEPGAFFPQWSSSRIDYDGRGNAGKSGTLPTPVITNVESPAGRRRFLGEFGGAARRSDRLDEGPPDRQPDAR